LRGKGLQSSESSREGFHPCAAVGSAQLCPKGSPGTQSPPVRAAPGLGVLRPGPHSRCWRGAQNHRHSLQHQHCREGAQGPGCQSWRGGGGGRVRRKRLSPTPALSPCRRCPRGDGPGSLSPLPVLPGASVPPRPTAAEAPEALSPGEAVGNRQPTRQSHRCSAAGQPRGPGSAPQPSTAPGARREFNRAGGCRSQARKSKGNASGKPAAGHHLHLF